MDVDSLPFFIIENSPSKESNKERARRHLRPLAELVRLSSVSVLYTEISSDGPDCEETIESGLFLGWPL